MVLVHRRTIAGSAPRRRQALLRTIERAASIASIRVRPVLAPALASLRQYFDRAARFHLIADDVQLDGGDRASRSPSPRMSAFGETLGTPAAQAKLMVLKHYLTEGR
jgi:hypothetical protein